MPHFLITNGDIKGTNIILSRKNICIMRITGENIMTFDFKDRYLLAKHLNNLSFGESEGKGFIEANKRTIVVECFLALFNELRPVAFNLISKQYPDRKNEFSSWNEEEPHEFMNYFYEQVPSLKYLPIEIFSFLSEVCEEAKVLEEKWYLCNHELNIGFDKVMEMSEWALKITGEALEKLTMVNSYLEKS
jgi:hypothetical protein